MPNLIHSLDASNIHLLIEELLNEDINISLYTIHDCFAATANTMNTIEKLVKKAFIKIYFSDTPYLQKMHNSLIDQIKSYATSVRKDFITGKEFITINVGDFNQEVEEIELPQIPDSFLSEKNVKIFMKGILSSPYFIN